MSHPDGRWTQVAVHPKPIPQGTLRAILRQTDLTIEDLLKAVSQWIYTRDIKSKCLLNKAGDLKIPAFLSQRN